MAKDFGKGSGNSAFQAGLAASSMLKKNLRRGERVFLNLRLRVFAPVERGDDFLGEGKTIDVSDQRSRAETVGCIRNLSLGNEVVLVSGLAREGVNFFSSNHYPEGASIEMAIPYTSKAPNVFSLVRIVAARREKNGSLTEYRAAYLVSGDFADEVP